MPSTKDYNIRNLEKFLVTARMSDRVEVCELVMPDYQKVLARFKKVVKAYKYASEEEVCIHSDKDKEVGEVKVERHDVIYLLARDLEIVMRNAWIEGQDKLLADSRAEHQAMRKKLNNGEISLDEWIAFKDRPRDERIDWARVHDMLLKAF